MKALRSHSQSTTEFEILAGFSEFNVPQDLHSRGRQLHRTGGDWSLLFSPHLLADTETEVLQSSSSKPWSSSSWPIPHLPF